jgi:exosortase
VTTTAPSATAKVPPKDPTFVEFWQQMPHKGAFGLILLAWLALFHWLGNSTFGYKDTASLFGWLQYCYSMRTEDHVFVVPFLVAGVVWYKRQELLALTKRTWWPAVALLALGLFLHICGYVIQQARISYLGFVAGIYALMGIIWGPAWLRGIFFPFFLFVFCMPLGNSADLITQPLRRVVAELAASISHYGLGIDVVRQGSQIFDSTRSIQYDVAPACSGIRSLAAMGLFSTLYGFLGFTKAWKRWLIMLSAIPLAVAGNTARITTTIVVGKTWGQEAGARIEQNLGFVTFAIGLLGLFIIGYWVREDKAKAARTRSQSPAEALQPKVTA